MEKTSTVSMVRSFNILFSLVLQACLMTAPGWLQWAGGAVIFLAIGLTGMEIQHIRRVCRCVSRLIACEKPVGGADGDADVERAVTGGDGEGEGMLTAAAVERERKLSAGAGSSGCGSESSGFASGPPSATSESP